MRHHYVVEPWEVSQNPGLLDTDRDAVASESDERSDLRDLTRISWSNGDRLTNLLDPSCLDNRIVWIELHLFCCCCGALSRLLLDRFRRSLSRYPRRAQNMLPSLRLFLRLDVFRKNLEPGKRLWECLRIAKETLDDLLLRKGVTFPCRTRVQSIRPGQREVQAQIGIARSISAKEEACAARRIRRRGQVRFHLGKDGANRSQCERTRLDEIGQLERASG